MAYRMVTLSLLLGFGLVDAVQKNSEHLQVTADTKAADFVAPANVSNASLAVASITTKAQSLPNFGLGASSIIMSSLAVAICYFSVYLWLTIVRTKNQYYYPTALPGTFERVLDVTITYCVYVAPMLCVMYFEVVKRYTLPPVWLQWVIVACSFLFCLQAVSYIASEWCLINTLNTQSENRSVASVKIWRNVCNVSTAVLYMLVGVILFAIFFVGTEDVPIGHYCTLFLIATYMGVYFVLFVLRSHRPQSTTSIGIEIMKLATIAINFAPMLCMLFIGAQLTLDWVGLEIPVGIEQWMYIATFAVVFQVLFVILAPILSDADLEVVGPNGDVDFVSEHAWILSAFSFARCLLMVVMCVGVVFMCMMLWAATPNSTMATCLMYFSIFYFVTYFVLWFVMFSDPVVGRTVKVLKVVKDTVHFCPMISALFLLAFAKAKLFSETAVPQSYSQDFMLITTFALGIQVAMICITGCLGKSHDLSQLCLVGLFVAMVAVYLGIAVVAISTFLINADNAKVDGAWFAH